MNYNTSTERSSLGRATRLHTQKSCKQRKEETGWRDPSFIHTLNPHTHTHDQWPCRGSRVSQYEATNNNEYSTSFSFPSTWNCVHTHTHSHNRPQKEHRGTHRFQGIWRRWNVILQVEGSEMKTGKVTRGLAGLLLQRTEAVLHVLQQLSVLCLNLSLAVLDWVLCRCRNTFLSCEQKTRYLSRLCKSYKALTMACILAVVYAHQFLELGGEKRQRACI